MSGWHKVLPHGWGVGVHPSLESPAVSGYIIAEPCWARRTALSACHWMWLWVRLSGGWEATVKGAPTWSPAEMTEQTESEVFGVGFNVARQESQPLFTAHIVSVKSVSCLHGQCFMYRLSEDLRRRSLTPLRGNKMSIQWWCSWTDCVS